jgi:hypothetical protein
VSLDGVGLAGRGRGALVAEGVGELSAESGVLLGKSAVALVGFLQSMSQGVVGGPLAGGDGR